MKRISTRLLTILALALAVGLATGVSPYASSAPDGLERVADDQAFLDRGEHRDAPAPDYAFPGVDDPQLATGLAGFAGTLGVFAIGFGIATATRGGRLRTG
jgi:hypothetical protein